MKADDVQPYLNYLDKEITLTGVVSAFSAAVAALALDHSLGADKGEAVNVWRCGHTYVGAGVGLLLVAALLFYRQRSLLAYYFGQIALALSLGDQAEEEQRSTVNELLRQADAWVTWWWYQAGFVALCGGFVTLGLAVAATRWPLIADWRVAVPLAVACIVTVGIIAGLRYRALADADRSLAAKRVVAADGGQLRNHGTRRHRG